MSEDVVKNDNQENLVQLNLTNVLAAVVKNMGIVAVPMSLVLEDYSEYNIAVSLDDDSNLLLLELVKSTDVVEEK